MIKDIEETYLLQSINTKQFYVDDICMLEAYGENEPTLLRTVYKRKKIILKNAN